MVGSTKIFAKANMANAHKIFYTASGFVSELLHKSIDDIVRKNRISKDILEVEEKISPDNRIIPHIEAYNLYNSAIRENIDAIKQNLNDKEIIFVNLFSTVTPKLTKRSRNQKISVDPIDRNNSKKGYDPFSGLNSITYFINILYENLNYKNDSLQEMIEKTPVFIPISPLIQFGIYDDKNFRVYNGVNEICGYNIIDSVNEKLEEKGKKKIITGKTSENLRDNLYQANPAFYDGRLSALLLSIEERREPNENEVKEIKAIAGYNRWINAILIGRLMSSVKQEEFYYFGTKSSNSYTIASKAAEISGKTLYNLNLVENVDLPLEGVSNTSSLNKLEGYILSINDNSKKITLGEFFRELPYID